MHAEIRILRDIKEKQKTRALYDQAFGDPALFTDYYYEDKCRDNLIVEKEVDGKVVSMLHLNPYMLYVCGKQVKSYYIVAVATDQNRRRQGHMAEVLMAAFRHMELEGIPFCYLMPVDERIYQPFGFESICDFDRDRDRDISRAIPPFDIYCIRDDVYMRRQKREEEIVAMLDGADDLPKHPVIMARIINRRAFSEISGLPKEAQETEMLAWLRKKRIYLCEEV